MSENAIEYRLGPRPMDVAARLPGGWTRLANARRLSEADVADWVVLHTLTEEDRQLNEDFKAYQSWLNAVLDVVGEPPGGDYDQLGEHVKKVLADARAERGDPQRHKMSPSEIKLKMLVEFEKVDVDGLTMREAADRAGVSSASNYTSRFGSDLVNSKWVIDTIHKQGHARIYVIAQAGLRELARQRGQA